MSNDKKMTHLEAVGQLKGAVVELENMQVPNVDAIEPLMKQGVEAYSVASERISSVKKMLGDLKEAD